MGQADLGNLMPDLWGSAITQEWINYLFEVNGVVDTDLGTAADADAKIAAVRADAEKRRAGITAGFEAARAGYADRVFGLVTGGADE